MRSSIQKIRSAVSLRNLIATVFSEQDEMPSEGAHFSQPNRLFMLRTASDAPVSNERPPSPRKYLWVRRTSRRAYNMHMSRMRHSISDINPLPAIAVFGAVAGIALLLLLLVR